MHLALTGPGPTGTVKSDSTVQVNSGLEQWSFTLHCSLN